MAFLNDTGLQELRARLEAVYTRRINGSGGDVGIVADSEGKVVSIPYFHIDTEGRVTSYGVRSHVVKLIVSAPSIAHSQTSSVSRYEGEQGYIRDTYTYTHNVTVTRTTDDGETYWKCYGASSSFTGTSATVRAITNTSNSAISYAATAYTLQDGAASATTTYTGTVPAQSHVCVCSCGCDCRCSCRRT